MMIRPPNIDHFAEIPLVFVSMVSDVTGKVGQLPIAFDDRSIFVVAELARSKPLRPVRHIKQAPVTEPLHGLDNLIPFPQRLFAEEKIEMNTELGQLPANG